MIRLEGGYFLSITIDGKRLDNSNNVFYKLTLIENVAFNVPQLELVLHNIGDLVESSPIADGTKIGISLVTEGLGDREVEEQRIYFRVFSYSLKNYNQGYGFVIKAIYDAPKLFQTKITSIDGVSSTVFTEISSKLGVKSSVDLSRDTQVWISPGFRVIKFLDHVCDHSWASNSSCYCWCIRRDNTLLLYDLSRRMVKKPRWVFKSTDELSSSSDVRYEDFEISSNSGFFNYYSSYGGNYSTFDVTTGDSIDITADKAFKSNIKLQMNKSMKGSQRSSLEPFIAGNTHDNYTRAKIQNEKLRGLHSVRVNLMSEQPNDVQLLDLVLVAIPSSNSGSIEKTYSGNYLVSRITTVIESNKITRGHSLIRTGINNFKSDLV